MVLRVSDSGRMMAAPLLNFVLSMFTITNRSGLNSDKLRFIKSEFELKQLSEIFEGYT